jgi:hypothetical protein
MRTRQVAVAKWVAISLGTMNAAATGYWLAGGTALLSTVGGEIEEWGRQRSGGVLVVLAVVLLVKVGVAVLPLVLDRVRGPYVRQVGRGLGWTAAVVLTLYGGLLTVVGLMVQAGVVDESSDADDTALAWHAFLWDPWFLAWGIALGSWLWLSIRPAHHAS